MRSVILILTAREKIDSVDKTAHAATSLIEEVRSEQARRRARTGDGPDYET